MINLVFFGAPGSGKGTQSDILEEKFGVKHVSTGEMLREEIRNNTELGKIADALISKGNLAPDDLVIKILRNTIEEKEGQGLIFDGFPRNIAQLHALDEILKDFNQQIDLVISLDVPEEILIERLLNRGKVSHRADDNRESIEQRLKVYHEQSEHVMHEYERQGKLIHITGVKPIEEISIDIEKAVKNHLKV